MAYNLAVKITWDEAKNLANQEKHGISFEEAQELFTSGREYLAIFDEAHSAIEDRFIAVGPIDRGLVLVIWVDRDETIVRIVSARWAQRPERDLYRAYMEGRPP